MSKRRRRRPRRCNPERFTIDEAQTATLLVTEGHLRCARSKKHPRAYPQILIEMCDKEALEPASRVFGTEIGPARRKRMLCLPHLFQPDGKGIWRIRKTENQWNNSSKD